MARLGGSRQTWSFSWIDGWLLGWLLGFLLSSWFCSLFARFGIYSFCSIFIIARLQ